MSDNTVIKMLGRDFSPKRKGMEPGTILNACRSPKEEREAETKKLGNVILRGGLGCGLMVENLLSMCVKSLGSPPAYPPAPGQDSDGRL